MTFFIPKGANYRDYVMKALGEYDVDDNSAPVCAAVTEYLEVAPQGCFRAIEVLRRINFFWPNLTSASLHSRKVNPGERVGIYVTVEPAKLEPEHTLRPEHRQEKA